jgi:hypothetical protein
MLIHASSHHRITASLHAPHPQRVRTWIPGSARAALLCVRWSPTRPGVFAVASATGRIFLYHLTRNARAPVSVFVPGRGTTGTSGTGRAGADAAILALAFHPTRKDQLACVDGRGRVQVWRLPSLGPCSLEEARAALHALRDGEAGGKRVI